MHRQHFRNPRLFTIALLAAALMILAACSSDPALAVYLETRQDQLHHPASNSYRAVSFTVEPGTPAKGIAQDLAAQGLIDDPLLFEAYVRANGLANRLEAGTFTLSPDMTPVEIAQELQNSLAASISVTIPEGWRLEQVADFLRRGGVVDGNEYLHLGQGDLFSAAGIAVEQYPFLALRPEGSSLEGYLYPDTYELPAQETTALDLIRRQLDEFAARVMPLYWEAIAQGSTQQELHDVITLASIVEREAVVDEERPLIAGVYLNRLAIDMRLEADPTVQYAMGYQVATDQWWKSPVSLAEYQFVDSPYNTYMNPGLPPGPIANPGLSSIQAVLAPAQHDFLYFVASPDRSGRHVFSTTFEEHLANVRKYRGE